MEYKKHLSEPWFSLVKLNIKTIEGRLNKGDFSKMKINDIIIFYNEDFNYREIKVKITKINKFKSFEDYLRKETIKRCLPGFTSINDGLDVYYKYFTKQQEKEYGIVSVHLKV